MDGVQRSSAGLARDGIRFAQVPGAESCFHSTGGSPNAAPWSAANPGPSRVSKHLAAASRTSRPHPAARSHAFGAGAPAEWPPSPPGGEGLVRLLGRT